MTLLPNHHLIPLGPSCCFLLAALATHAAVSAEIPKAPVPKSPYVAVVYRYADTLLERVRDQTGPHKTGLFLSALDRQTLSPLTNRPPAPTGVREIDRVGRPDGPLVGANPQHDENLLRLLYTLTELTAKPKYRQAADAALQWFFENAASPGTRLLPWGEHMSWDTIGDEPIFANGTPDGTHEFFRPWLLWPHCFRVTPQASAAVALGLWEHQIANHQSGAFDRHASFKRHGPAEGMDFPRHAGFYLRAWAEGYAQTKDEQFLEAIECLLTRFEKKRASSKGFIEAYSGSTNGLPQSALSLAIDCEGAAHRVPPKLAERLRAFAAAEDVFFCGLPHDLKVGGGFITEINGESGRVAGAVSERWTARYGSATTAQIGLMCVARYENTGRPAYRELIHAAADGYFGELPGPTVDVWPGTFGQVISLQLAAWRSTADAKYLERARKIADSAIEEFFGDHPLPRASRGSQHYEAVTGADTLALALLELHLHVLHITAVRCPANTVDR